MWFANLTHDTDQLCFTESGIRIQAVAESGFSSDPNAPGFCMTKKCKAENFLNHHIIFLNIHKDVQAPGEASSPNRELFIFIFFGGNFGLNPDPDPLTQLNPNIVRSEAVLIRVGLFLCVNLFCLFQSALLNIFSVLCCQDKAIVAIDIFDELIGRIPVPMTFVMGGGGGGCMCPVFEKIF